MCHKTLAAILIPSPIPLEGQENLCPDLFRLVYSCTVKILEYWLPNVKCFGILVSYFSNGRIEMLKDIKLLLTDASLRNALK